MKNELAFWHAEHVYFNRLLELLHKEIDVFATAERPNYQLMLDVISYLREYCDEYHHRREDAAFEILAKRCPDMELTLARLRQEHHVIAHAGAKLMKFLVAILGEAMVSRAEVEAAAATYLVYYGNHIAKEEEDVLTRAAKVLTPEDWEVVKAAAPVGRDPVFGDHPEKRYRNLRRQIALET